VFVAEKSSLNGILRFCRLEGSIQVSAFALFQCSSALLCFIQFSSFSVIVCLSSVSHFPCRLFFLIVQNQSQQRVTFAKLGSNQGKHPLQYTAHPRAGTLKSDS
jgi:hypothetical protein